MDTRYHWESASNIPIMPTAEVCAAACRTVDDVIRHGRSMDQTAIDRLSELPTGAHGEAREIAWGTVRWFYQYRPVLHQLLHKPLKKTDRILEALMLCGLYQLDFLDEPDYAITSGTVDACKLLKRKQACGLVNAVLREYLRNRDENPKSVSATGHAMPEWLVQQLRSSWPIQWQNIVEACNEQPPLTLRVNALRHHRDDYVRQLTASGLAATASPISQWAVTLDRAVPVEDIPGFATGDISVQDAAAQLTPLFTGSLAGHSVLDACAAPGGKTCHLLEVATNMNSMTALDLPKRTFKIEENLTRLGLKANVIAGDATRPDQWWNGQPFHCIVLDAPCSATGVIRRHPDIRIHRKETDIVAFSERQLEFLNALWPLLTAGGRLVYITCSVLPLENDEVIEKFVRNTHDANIVKAPANIGITTRYGVQLLPQPSGTDGFFYAALDRDVRNRGKIGQTSV